MLSPAAGNRQELETKELHWVPPIPSPYTLPWQGGQGMTLRNDCQAKGTESGSCSLPALHAGTPKSSSSPPWQDHLSRVRSQHRTHRLLGKRGMWGRPVRDRVLGQVKGTMATPFPMILCVLSSSSLQTSAHLGVRLKAQVRDRADVMLGKGLAGPRGSLCVRCGQGLCGWRWGRLNGRLRPADLRPPAEPQSHL